MIRDCDRLAASRSNYCFEHQPGNPSTKRKKAAKKKAKRKKVARKKVARKRAARKKR